MRNECTIIAFFIGSFSVRHDLSFRNVHVNSVGEGTGRGARWGFPQKKKIRVVCSFLYGDWGVLRRSALKIDQFKIVIVPSQIARYKSDKIRGVSGSSEQIRWFRCCPIQIYIFTKNGIVQAYTILLKMYFFVSHVIIARARRGSKYTF